MVDESSENQRVSASGVFPDYRHLFVGSGEPGHNWGACDRKHRDSQCCSDSYLRNWSGEEPSQAITGGPNDSFSRINKKISEFKRGWCKTVRFGPTPLLLMLMTASKSPLSFDRQTYRTPQSFRDDHFDAGREPMHHGHPSWWSRKCNRPESQFWQRPWHYFHSRPL